MKRRIGLALACVAGVVVLMGAAADAPKPVREVSAQDLESGGAIVVGHLGKQLGTYMTVEGEYPGRALNPGQCDFIVDKLSGSELKANVWVALEDSQSNKPLVEHHRYRLRGYELGIYGPMPGDLETATPKASQEEQSALTATPITYMTYYYVTKAEDLGAAKGANP